MSSALASGSDLDTGGVVTTLAPARIDGPVIEAERDQDADDGVRQAQASVQSGSASAQVAPNDVAVQVSAMDDEKHAQDVRLHVEAEAVAQEHEESVRQDAEEAHQQEVVEAVAEAHEQAPELAPEPAETTHEPEQSHQE